METRVLTAHVPAALAIKVDAMAQHLERSRGWIIKQALAEWIAVEEEHHRLTLEALEEVEAGRSIAHKRVRAWADSLDLEVPLPLPR